MGATNIQEVIERFKGLPVGADNDDPHVIAAAVRELEAIRMAAKFLVSASQDVNGAVEAMGTMQGIAEETP